MSLNTFWLERSRKRFKARLVQTFAVAHKWVLRMHRPGFESQEFKVRELKLCDVAYNELAYVTETSSSRGVGEPLCEDCLDARREIVALRKKVSIL